MTRVLSRSGGRLGASPAGAMGADSVGSSSYSFSPFASPNTAPVAWEVDGPPFSMGASVPARITLVIRLPETVKRSAKSTLSGSGGSGWSKRS